jgi:outer membrane lipopolysaccharide assembly protein LptE/RlpB
MTSRLSVLGLLCGAALLLAGCSHYQLGTTGKLAFTTLYVEPVANKAHIPQAQAILSTRIRDAFANDSRVTLVNSPEAADATLQVVIKDYHRDISSLLEADPGRARKFTLTLGVDCTLRQNRTGQVLFADRRVSAQRDAFTDGGQLQAEYQDVPLLAQSLADKIAHAVLDVW